MADQPPVGGPALCRHGDLTPPETARVRQAEHAANLATCTDGRYPALCRHQDLSQAEQQRVSSAEAAQANSPRANLAASYRRKSLHTSSCESGHWIDSVMGDGSVIKLEDGSLWQVDDADTADSSTWVEATDIVVCDGKLINTEDNESVEAERLR